MTARDLIAEVSSELRSDIHKAKLREERSEYFKTWRERSADRRSREPAHTKHEALLLSLEALYEATTERRPFSWACSHQQKIGALDWCVSRAVGEAM